MLFLAVAISGAVFMSCGKLGCDSGDQSPEAGKVEIVIYELSNPDEALNQIKNSITATQWSKYLDKRSGIDTDDPILTCFSAGVKSANALLAVYNGDYQTAEAIADSLKNISTRLRVDVEGIASAVKSLKDALNEQDAKLKAQKVKDALNLLRDRVVKTMNDVNKKEYALAIQYGLWVESVRHASGFVSDSYSAKASNVLNRKTEAEYFQREFTALGSSNSFYTEAAESSAKFAALMTAKKGILAKGAVADIHGLATRIYKKFTK